MGSFSVWHWLIVLLIVVLIFGTSRIPELGRGLGEGIKNFKKGLSDDPKDDESPPGRAEPKRLSGKDDKVSSDDDTVGGKQKSKATDEGSEKRA